MNPSGLFDRFDPKRAVEIIISPEMRAVKFIDRNDRTLARVRFRNPQDTMTKGLAIAGKWLKILQESP